MDEENLISLVRNYQELYDGSDHNYHNTNRKENVWEEIAKEIGKTVDECKKRWTTLRDAYRRALKLRETRSRDPAKKKRPWRFEKQMKFLQPFIAERNQISNVTFDKVKKVDPEVYNTTDMSITQGEHVTPSTSKFPGTSKKIQKNSVQKKQTLTTTIALLNYLKDKEEKKKTVVHDRPTDHIKKFFECMEETVRTLPRELIITVKSQIFNIVHEAEMHNLRNSEKCSTNDSDMYSQEFQLAVSPQSGRTPTASASLQSQNDIEDIEVG